MKKKQEANIISFRILFNKKGYLISETGGLPLTDAAKVFKGFDLKVIQTVIREGKQRIEKIHNELEAELDALNSN